ncbi:MAG TPA: choice-of-anchor L domain-containing protein [Flavobacteriales bacterium]
MKLSSRDLFVPLLALGSLSTQAQIVLQQDQSPFALVQNVLMGPDIVINNVRFNGVAGSVVAPVGAGPSEIGRFVGSNTSLGLTEGVFLCTGVASVHLPGPNDRLEPVGGGMNGPDGYQTPDLDLSRLTGWVWADSLGGANIHNKAVLEFDLVPFNDMLEFRYVFSSEEYERWACSQYNDVFGFFLSGPGISGPFINDAMNIAFVPGSLSPVSINAVNSGLMNANNANGPWDDLFHYCEDDPNWQANSIHYRYNGGQWSSPQPPSGVEQLEAPFNNDPYYIQHNGMTVVLTASASVLIGGTYHIKLALGNVNDSSYPSAVFLDGSSFRAADRFTLTVDEGINVDLSGTDPIVLQSDEDSVYLRFNRWGGFYLDEDLQITVEGDAVAGEDYAPALPASIHFDQLDSAVTFALAVPVRSDSTSELIVNLITSNGNKVAAFPLIIEQPPISTGMAGIGVIEGLSVFPNPAEDMLNIVLPYGLKGRTELEVLDPAGRVVKQQVLNGAAKAIIDLGGLPNGLYTVKAMANGRMATARVSVRH